MTALMQATDPQSRWARALGLLAVAREAEHRMRHAEGEAERDRGAEDYATALDAMAVEMSLLAETGVLDGITEYLAIVYGRAD